jgi:AraC-like DNA-binding protein/quercetin dioxygenase-like cupin family protein
MKTLIQKIHVEEEQSFACRSYTTPNFETNWHKHEEFELIVITSGSGTVMVGDYVGEYMPNDAFFIAGNIPHWFRKHEPKAVGSAVVAQFKKDIFGDAFLQNPELRNIRLLLLKQVGIQFTKTASTQMANILFELEHSNKFRRIQLLMQLLDFISTTKQSNTICNEFNSNNKHVNPTIETIIEYSLKNYLQPITLETVSAICKMSIPTFCRFFKTNIKKTYFDFLQELRINHACKLLANTEKAVMEICFESGYNSWSHFSKQFKKVKNLTPSAYRNSFLTY